METSVKIYSFGFSEKRTYLFAALFVLGNIVLPQLCHLIPRGGLIFLPIYFFTLVGSYKYGMRVGLLTAVFSPLVNSALFGMPAAAVLPSILIKSVLLAVAASLAASYSRRVSLLMLLAVIVAYQVFGSFAEWLIDGDFYSAITDFRLGIPGMFVQLLGGYAFIKYVIRK
jgi:hypothetical protein